MNDIKEICFEKVTAYESVDFPLPERKTKDSAGYDFTLPERVVIPSIYSTLIKILKEYITRPEFINSMGASEFIQVLGKRDPKDYEDNPVLAQELLTKEVPALLPGLIADLPNIFTLDLETAQDIISKAGARATLVPTGVKAKIKSNQKLELMVRSSLPFKSYLIMSNSIGLIDADYYNNEDNEGHIFFQLINLSPFNIVLNKGDVIGQGVISEYNKTSDDEATGERTGGFGSTTERK